MLIKIYDKGICLDDICLDDILNFRHRLLLDLKNAILISRPDKVAFLYLNGTFFGNQKRIQAFMEKLPPEDQLELIFHMDLLC